MQTNTSVLDCTGLLYWAGQNSFFCILPWFPSFHLLPYLYDCSGFLLLLVKCFWLNACHLGPLWRIFLAFIFLILFLLYFNPMIPICLFILTNTLLEKGTRTHYTNTLSISFLFQPTAFKLLCPLLPCSDDNISTKITNDQAVKSNGNVS